MRSGKFLNTTEFLESFKLSKDRDEQDFAEELLEIVDCSDEVDEYHTIKDWLSEATKIDDIEEAIQGLLDKSDHLTEITDFIIKTRPEYTGIEIDDIIADILIKLPPLQEYDL